jgi:hypothetical protein
MELYLGNSLILPSLASKIWGMLSLGLIFPTPRQTPPTYPTSMCVTQTVSVPAGSPCELWTLFPLTSLASDGSSRAVWLVHWVPWLDPLKVWVCSEQLPFCSFDLWILFPHPHPRLSAPCPQLCKTTELCLVPPHSTMAWEFSWKVRRGNSRAHLCSFSFLKDHSASLPDFHCPETVLWCSFPVVVLNRKTFKLEAKVH